MAIVDSLATALISHILLTGLNHLHALPHALPPLRIKYVVQSKILIWNSHLQFSLANWLIYLSSNHNMWARLCSSRFYWRNDCRLEVLVNKYMEHPHTFPLTLSEFLDFTGAELANLLWLYNAAQYGVGGNFVSRVSLVYETLHPGYDPEVDEITL